MRRRRANALPAARARRHVKRAPQLNGPLTLTLVTTRNAITTPATTPTVTPPAPPPSPPPPPPSSSPPAPLPPTSTSTPQSPPPRPEVSVVPPRPSVSGPQSSSSSAADSIFGASRPLPAGAIVGITIGGALILIALVVFLLRFRFRSSRSTKRSTWLAKGGITPASFAPAERYGPMTGETSPGVAFAYAQQNATYPRPPIPPAPPSMAYGADSSPVPMMISPVTASQAPGAALVKFTFIPSLPDELTISNGEVVQIVQEFDDGWALCANSRDVQGMVPLECLERQQDGLVRNRTVRSDLSVPAERSQRRSSLNAQAMLGRGPY